MSRYIDADKLQQDYKEIHDGKRSLLIDTAPTADVVDRDKAQKEIDYWHDKAQSYEKTILKLSLNKVDVVEVVRCKDCKYGHLRDNTKRNSSIYCDFGIGVHKENYCSYGERADT